MSSMARNFSFLVSIIFIGIMSGCETAPTRNNGHVTGNAYLYGHFYLYSEKTTEDWFEHHLTMGFVLKCNNKEQHIIKFNHKEPLQVITLKPTRCEFSEIQYIDEQGKIRGRVKTRKTSNTNFKILPNTATYLGSYHLYVTPYASTTETDLSPWRFTDIYNDYNETTDKMKILHPTLINIPTNDNMIMPVQRPSNLR